MTRRSSGGGQSLHYDVPTITMQSIRLKTASTLDKKIARMHGRSDTKHFFAHHDITIPRVKWMEETEGMV